MPTHPSFIPDSFVKYYHDKALYSFITCLKELNTNLLRLRQILTERDYTRAYKILHLMKGPILLIENQKLIDQIELISVALQNEKSGDQLEKDLNKLAIEIKTLFDELQGDRHHVDILIYSKDYLFNDHLLDKLSSWSFSNQVVKCDDLKRMGSQIKVLLPDIVLLIGIKTKVLFHEEIINAKRRYPGTSFLFLDGLRSWDEQAHYQRLEKMIVRSISHDAFVPEK